MGAAAEESSASSRYRLILKIATGGVATVWIGAVRGGLGFRQLVAIKKPHAHLFEQPTIRNELVTEARLASMIQHGNVVDVRDVDVSGDQINLVMDYIEGASLAELSRAAKDAGTTLPPKVVLRIIVDSCAGLHAAHELVDEDGKPASLVHRDVSPQNILVGLDGIARVTDFGIAKAMTSQDEKTDEGLVKGKLSYMSPEYLTGKGCDRRLDVFALATVCWEALANERCFKGDTDLDTANRILKTPARKLSSVAPSLGTALDDVLATAMERRADKRFPTMRSFATALEAAGEKMMGTHADVAATVKSLMGAALDERRTKVRAALAEDGPRSSSPNIPVLTPSTPDVNDSRSSHPVGLSSGLVPPDITGPREARTSDPSVMSSAIPTQRKPLKLIVAGVCGFALLVLIAGVAMSSKSDRTTTNGKGTQPTGSHPDPSPPVPGTSSVARREDPIPEPPKPEDIELETTPSSTPTVSSATMATPAPKPAPRPGPGPVTKPTGSGGKKPVPPNPYGKW